MTTKSGRDLRRVLATQLEIHHVYDLGDTKLFSAAVLPAVVIGAKASPAQQDFDITSIYECSTDGAGVTAVDNVLSELRHDGPERVETGGKRFTIRRSRIQPRGWDHPWVAASCPP